MSGEIAFEPKSKCTHMVVIGCIFTLSATLCATADAKMGRLSIEQRDARLEHSKELLGRYYDRSIVRTGEEIQKVNGEIYRWTRASLPKKYLKKAGKIAQTIIDEAHRHGFDPIFVMSVIQTERSFNPDVVGGVGEIGLMQVRPSTGKWIAEKTGLRWRGNRSLRDPLSNIKIGVAYLAFLREHFDSHARLYLAAYNMGQSNVRELLVRSKWPREYPSRVMNVYVDYYSKLKEKYDIAEDRTVAATEES